MENLPLFLTPLTMPEQITRVLDACHNQPTVATMADTNNNKGGGNLGWLKRSPLTDIHRERRQYVGKDDNDNKVSWCKYCLTGWVRKCQAASRCINCKHQDWPPSCSCLEDIVIAEAEMKVTVDYLFGFALLTKQEQQTLLMEWIKYSNTVGRHYLRGEPGRRMTFLLPGTTHLICKDALCLFSWAWQYGMGHSNEDGEGALATLAWTCWKAGEQTRSGVGHHHEGLLWAHETTSSCSCHIDCKGYGSSWWRRSNNITLRWRWWTVRSSVAHEQTWHLQCFTCWTRLALQVW